MEKTNVRRNFKSSLFSMIFEEKSELLSLYNAINGSNYEDPELLEITTIQDVLFMGIKNDLSFIIDEYMNLYEAQSTWNSNMPLRGLFYFSSLYQGYVESRQLDIYSSVRLKLPFPKYVVLYNGSREEPERQTLCLTESFEYADREEEQGKSKIGLAAVECRAEVININWGHNKQLMKQCRKLYEYAYLVEQVRIYLSQGIKLKTAVDRAVEKCIKEGILKSFLMKNRAEVKQMILTEYDEKRHIENEKEIARKEAFREGNKQGVEQGIKVIIADNLREKISRERILEKLQEWFSLDQETAVKYYEKYACEAEEKR